MRKTKTIKKVGKKRTKAIIRKKKAIGTKFILTLWIILSLVQAVMVYSLIQEEVNSLVASVVAYE